MRKWSTAEGAVTVERTHDVVLGEMPGSRTAVFGRVESKEMIRCWTHKLVAVTEAWMGLTAMHVALRTRHVALDTSILY